MNDDNLELFGFDDVCLDNMPTSQYVEKHKHMRKLYKALKHELDDAGLDTGIALQQLDVICQRFGGLKFYLGKVTSLFRNINIWRDDDGSYSSANTLTLAKKYKLCSPRISNILSKMSKKMQGLCVYKVCTNEEIIELAPELLPQAAREIHEILLEQLGNEPLCKTIALRQLTALCEALGGKEIYIPNGHRLQEKMRHYQVWNEFNGNNVYLLSSKFGMTERQIYNIIKDMRAQEQSRHQYDLF